MSRQGRSRPATKRTSSVLRGKTLAAVARNIDAAHRHVRTAQFDRLLLNEITAQDKSWNALPVDSLEYLQGRCVVAELNDNFGRYEQAEEALSSAGPAARGFLTSASIDSSLYDEFAGRYWKRQIWVLLNYAHTAYRRGEYDRSREMLAIAESAVERLDGEQPRSFGTRARLNYALGLVFRQRNEFDRAEEAFASAIRWASLRLGPDDPARSRLARHRRSMEVNWTIGKCLVFGLGWIRYTSGRLAEAAMLIEAGRTVLRGSNDLVHHQEANLWAACVARAQAGTDQQRLDQVITALSGCYDALTDLHPIYQARAAYELALAYLYCRRYADARRWLARVKEVAERMGRRRWLGSAAVVESRIARGEGRLIDAMELAERAWDMADAALDNAGKAEALIARSEAVLASKPDQADYERARRDLRAALNSAPGNPKTQAACHLHLARLHIQLGEYPWAHEAYASYEAVRERVQSGFIVALAQDVRRQLDSGDFVVAASSETHLNYESRRVELQQFLLLQAKARTQSQSEVAKLLGISRPTLYEWQRRPQRRPVRKRRARSTDA